MKRLLERAARWAALAALAAVLIPLVVYLLMHPARPGVGDGTDRGPRTTGAVR